MNEEERSAAAVHGVLLVDKPAGPTSHDVVDRARQVLGTRRVGHTGTLDPFATGLLALCVGKATRLARFLAAGEKRYAATVRLGFATTTDDLTGEPLGLPRPVTVGLEGVRAAAASLVGPQLQLPPAYSAKRRGGRRLYELARAGVAVEREGAPVVVHSLEVLHVEGDRVALDVRCSAGTYVRALARDLGQALGTGGHLAELRRTESGVFHVAEAVQWEELPVQARDRLVRVDDLLLELPAVRVGVEGMAALRHGRDLEEPLVVAGFPGPPPPPRLRALDAQGRLLALLVPRGFTEGAPPFLVTRPVLHPDLVLVE